MTIERALFARLTSDTTVAEFLGIRVYPETAETERIKDFPYATYTQPDEDPVYHLRGFAGMTRATLALKVCAKLGAEREQLSKRLQTSLENWPAAVVTEGVQIRRVAVSQGDDYEPPNDGSEKGVYGRVVGLDIWYRDMEA